MQICKCGFFNEDGKIIAIEERSVCRKINHNIELQRGDLFNAQMNKICKSANVLKVKSALSREDLGGLLCHVRIG